VALFLLTLLFVQLLPLIALTQEDTNRKLQYTFHTEEFAMLKYIDYRSDTVTHPSDAMKQAMIEAPIGDDVYGEDPTVLELQDRLAKQFGKEAGLFFPSGTQSNLVAMLSHCQRGEEVITAQEYHVFTYEARGASVLGGVALHPLASSAYGTISPADVQAAIKIDDPHYAVSRLLSLENTVSGCVQPPQIIQEATKIAHDAGLKTHLDGARVFNASVASNTAPAELCKHFDTVSICLSKGLGTPAGSVLVGDKKTIHYALRQRKMLGGGMRQSGMLAAAGLYALDNNIERLALDHSNAKILAEALSEIPQLNVDINRVQSNMVFIQPDKTEQAELAAHMKSNGIIIAQERLVLHLDIDEEMVGKTIEAFKSFYAGR
jgi:threonine aldolase